MAERFPCDKSAYRGTYEVEPRAVQAWLALGPGTGGTWGGAHAYRGYPQRIPVVNQRGGLERIVAVDDLSGLLADEITGLAQAWSDARSNTRAGRGDSADWRDLVA